MNEPVIDRFDARLKIIAIARQEISVYAKETSVWPFRQASAVIGEGIDQQGRSHPERITGKMQQNRTVM